MQEMKPEETRTEINLCHRIPKTSFIFKCHAVILQTMTQQPRQYAIFSRPCELRTTFSLLTTRASWVSTNLDLTHSNGSVLYAIATSLAFAANLCVDAPGNQGGICLRNGITLIMVPDGWQSVVTAAKICSAEVIYLWYLSPAGISYPNVVDILTAVLSLKMELATVNQSK